MNFIYQTAKKNPSHPALISPKGVLNYADLHAIAARAADCLKQNGITPGDRVALLAENRFEHLALILALWQARASAVLLSPRFPAAQVRGLLAKTSCSRIILPRLHGFGKSDTVSILVMEALLASQSSAVTLAEPASEMSPEQEATVLFTSGSTALPKAVVHSLRNHYYSALGANENLPFGPGDRWLLSLPIYHVGGLGILVRALVGGGAVVLAELKKSLPETIARFGITHLSLVPTQLYRMLRAGEVSVSALQSLKAILLGGSEIPKPLLDEAIRLRLPILTTYGCTEMSSQITATRLGESDEKQATAGKALRYRKIRIAVDGEVWVQGEVLFQGYIDSAGPSEDADFDSKTPRRGVSTNAKQGWFPTGDLGKLDADGYLTLTGRKDNLFISGGENISPEEIEACISDLLGVVNVIVVPVPDEEFGSRPVAFIQSAGPLDEKKLRDDLSRHLPRFKIPDRFLPWPELDAQTELKVRRSNFKEFAKAFMTKEKGTDFSRG